MQNKRISGAMNINYTLLVRDKVCSGIWVGILLLDAWNDTPIAAAVLVRFLVFLD